jgi:hypothetical protein
MGNSAAFPILRSADLYQLFGAARQLLTLADLTDGFVDLRANSRTYGLARYLPVMPSAYLDLKVPANLADSAREILAPVLDEADLAKDRDDGNLRLAPQLTADLVAALRRLPDLPVEVASVDQPIDSPVEPFLSVVGDDGGGVLWGLHFWPPVAELDLSLEPNHAHLQLSINSVGIWATEPATGHTLYVHVHPSEECRAEWLAQSIGSRIIGPMEDGF